MLPNDELYFRSEEAQKDGKWWKIFSIDNSRLLNEAIQELF